jgi:hypothetical protein
MEDELQPGFQFLFLFLFLVPAIFFMISQQNTLKTISPGNRLMRPGEVWFQLIPLFGLVWQFFVVTRIADSIQNEYRTMQEISFLGTGNSELVITPSTRPTFKAGIAYCILLSASVIPLLGSFFALAGIILWIIYWVELVRQKNILQKMILSA